jgi:hypothetical protein
MAMIKKFDEFINENYSEVYTLYIKFNEYNPKNKVNRAKLVEIGEGDNKIVLTTDNTDIRDSIWPYEAFLYPFFEKEEAETFISEITNYMDIEDYRIFPTSDRSPLAKKYFLK